MDVQVSSERARARSGLRSSFESQDIEPHTMRFTGSGGEYFRVWIVNVLLSILTLGLYTPWARRRTAQYFYGHTLVAGSPLEFTAQQRRMVVGFVVLLLLTVAYQLAVNTGQDTAVGLFILGGAALSPLIWGSAMRFRLANTRWRGLRLQFAASWREVYTASWPVFALALVWLGVFWGLQSLAPAAVVNEETGRKLPEVTAPLIGLVALGLLLTVLCIIRLEFNYRSLLVLRSRIGNEAGRWKPVYMDFVKLWLATLAVFLVSLLVLVALVAGLFTGSLGLVSKLGKGGMGLGIFVLIMAAFVGALLAMMLATAPARAYREAALFRLTWSNIGVSRIARFKCNLSTGGYVLLRLRNMLLTVLTLGFFRPFAMVSEYRMKLESVTVHVKGGVDQVAGRLGRQQPGGISDALADAAGLDLIG
ncbi:YjgN family protein [[Acidovorax] ebreus]|uniref:YjgN family protein n=1 Tax=Diaphorobacter sp. LI3 TaxID=2952886 RepID=UPI002051F72E|nr:YjgN family protein [Diaphorobacter sp. LI3]